MRLALFIVVLCIASLGIGQAGVSQVDRPDRQQPSQRPSLEPRNAPTDNIAPGPRRPSETPPALPHQGAAPMNVAPVNVAPMNVAPGQFTPPPIPETRLPVQTTTTQTQVQGEVEAALEASGSGRIELYGRLSLTAEGRGTVWIDDESRVTWDDENLVEMERSGQGWLYTVSSNTNKVHVSGQDVQLVFEGDRLRVTAQGDGTAVMAGQGSYSEPDRSGRWSDQGVTIPIHSEGRVNSLSTTTTTTQRPAAAPPVIAPQGLPDVSRPGTARPPGGRTGGRR
jgi:hypothetical protein